MPIHLASDVNALNARLREGRRIGTIWSSLAHAIRVKRSKAGATFPE
jgi:hypothetical protein